LGDTWTKVAQGAVALLSDNDPADVGTVAAEGVGTAASRDDHVHILGENCVGATNIADDAVGSEHIETLDAALDCGKQQLQNLVIHKSSTPPSPAALGQLYYDTDDNQLYVCTAIS
jgi:hypothetical protein